MKKRLFSVCYMFILTLCFTSLVSAVKHFTEERIERNEKIKLQSIILEVLGITEDQAVSDKEIVNLFESRVRAVRVKDLTVYVGYKEDGKSIRGYAFPVGGPGFWGPVSGMTAVDSQGEKIIGIAFYEHSETPGLGARITEDWFESQFEGLSLDAPGKGKKIFYLKPEGTAKASNELDAITGATGTSRAVEAFLNRDFNDFLNEIRGPMKGIKKDA